MAVVVQWQNTRLWLVEREFDSLLPPYVVGWLAQISYLELPSQNKIKMVKKINILFVCRYNRFRSRVALAYFNKINKNKNVKAKSAGLIKGSPLNPKTVSLAKKLGIDISGKPKGLNSDLMAWQNVTVIVANDVPEQVFDRNKEYGKEVVVWRIRDAKEYDLKEIKRLIREITEKVEELNKNLQEK